MAFTVRAAEHLSCTETVFPRMRDRVSLLLRQPAPLSVFRLSGDDRLLLSRFFVRRGGDAECQSAKNACRAQSAEREVPVAFGPHRLRRTGGNGASCFGRMCGIACRIMPAVRRRPHAAARSSHGFSAVRGWRPAFRRGLVRFRRGAAPQDPARSFPKAEAAAACGTHPAGGG